MNNHEDKILSIANLANETRRLLSLIKDFSLDILALNDRIQSLVAIIESNEDVLVLKDDQDQYSIEVFDLNNEIEVPIDESTDEIAWSDIEIEPMDQINTWRKFRGKFGPDLTREARQVAKIMDDLIKDLQQNLNIMQRITENIATMTETMTDDFDISLDNIQPMLNSIDYVKESVKSSKLLQEDLNSLRTLLPRHEDLTPEEYLKRFPIRNPSAKEEIKAPFEECRPFPNAWTS